MLTAKIRTAIIALGASASLVVALTPAVSQAQSPFKEPEHVCRYGMGEYREGARIRVGDEWWTCEPNGTWAREPVKIVFVPPVLPGDPL
jgi:hypothetical protein